MTVLGSRESTGKDGYDNWRFREFRGDKEILKRKKKTVIIEIKAHNL